MWKAAAGGPLNCVDRQFQIADAIGFRLRQPPGANIDLDRGQDQARHAQCGVARLTLTHERVLLDALADMDVGGLLLADGRLPVHLRATGRQVVVAQEHPGFVRQRQQAAHGGEQGGGADRRSHGASQSGSDGRSARLGRCRCGAIEQGFDLRRERLAGLLVGEHAQVDIVPPRGDLVAPELQNTRIGQGHALAVSGAILVDAFQEQSVARLGVGEDPPLDVVHVGLQFPQQLFSRRLAPHRRQARRGVVPDDVIGHVRKHRLDIVDLPRGDHPRENGKKSGHERLGATRDELAGRRD
ncbi:hypothetical protein CC_2308 [Caulobacter vibrioides CB15]|uniref:Uncharacterized protein n=1 Tax=Caulobacter vibrioides (strain ATCC 19089 / CIP 103742 / CB 15) TaxID=190650 RepID=Q9A5Y9_CAUVC|nr:hypothetical protein CC_2308 [Caulobacter vibrioides CB15]